MNLILASASPRRREILTTLGVPFRVITADADETCDLADPGERVETIARRKCLAVRDSLPADTIDNGSPLILAADTLVTLDGLFLGKPRDEQDARDMLGHLRGRTHTVASGICLSYEGKIVTAHEYTGVTFSPMTDEEVAAYVATGESFGKAGGYAIQGFAARYITGIQGDYFNVVGLPVHCLYRTLLGSFGIRL